MAEGHLRKNFRPGSYGTRAKNFAVLDLGLILCFLGRVHGWRTNHEKNGATMQKHQKISDKMMKKSKKYCRNLELFAEKCCLFSEVTFS